MIEGLNLLVLRCSDIEQCRKFYECFGFKFEKHAHGSGPEHYAAKQGGVLELYPATETAPGDQVGLGFGVTDLASAAQQLQSAGFEPGAVKDQSWGRSFVIRDPQNRRVEVTLKS